MNDSTLTPGGAGIKGLTILQSNPIMTRVGGVLLLTFLLAVLLAAPVDAEPRIKVNCDIYATNYVDPIAFASHLHHQFGNTSTTNKSTADSLFNSKTTSCDMAWFTTAGWFPVERNEPVRGVNVYYRAPGDQTRVKDIPTGLKLIAEEQRYKCGGAPGDSAPEQSTPPYGCKQNWGTRLISPTAYR